MQNLLKGKLKPDGTWRKEDEFYEEQSRIEQEKIDKENKQNTQEPVIEGIANFCALNRSQSGRNNSGWDKLASALNDNKEVVRSEDIANTLNDSLKQFSKKMRIQKK